MKKYIISLFISLFIITQTSLANVCENLKQYTLPNGQTVVIKEIKNNPIVIIDTFIKTGSVNETEKNNGVAHFLEHLFFKGTLNHKRGEFEKAIESKGGVFNAATSRDYTHYYIKIDSKHFDEALKLHSDMLLNIAIPQNELDMERKVVLEEITRSLDNPSNKVFDNFMQIVFNNTPYARKILGTNEIIKNISRNEILEFHKQWYSPKNMVTVIVGDVDANKILPKIEKNFNSTIQNNPQPTQLPFREPKTTKQNIIIEKADVDTGYMIIGYKTAGTNNTKEAYALDMAASALANGQNSILYKILKEDNNLVLDIGGGNYELKTEGIFYVSTMFEPQNYDIVLAKIKEELENLKTNKISETKLNLIKNSIKRQYEYSNESISGIANMIGYDVAIGNGLTDYCSYLDTIDSITPEFIQETINKYFSEKNLAISVLLPKQTIKAQKQNIINISNKKTNKPKLISQEHGIKKYSLNNGITLLTQKNDINNIVAMKIFLKGGSLIEKKAGTSDILTNVITKGTKNKTAKEIEDALDEIGANISFDNNYEFFEITLKTTQNDFPRAFDILKELIEEPIFNENDIENAKKDAINAIISAKDYPQNIAFDNFYDKLHENSPFYKSNKLLEKTIPTITQDDIKTLHGEIFAAQNMLISVAGNFEENILFEKFLSLKTPSTFKPINKNLLKATYEPLTKNEIIEESKNAKGAWIIQGWKTKGLSNNDFITLKVISTYLGSGFSSKLFTNLRENKGLAYEVGASSSSNFNSGQILMYIGTNPENIKEAQEGFNKEIEELKTKYISQEDLCNIKTMLIGRLKLATETNMAKAYTNGYYEFFDKGYKFSYDYPQLIKKVNVQDIIEIANKYFSQPYIMSIVAEDKYINKKGQ